MIQRLPAFGLSAFSAIVVATPVALLLNAFVAPAKEPAELASPQREAPVELVVAPSREHSAPTTATDDGGEPIVEELAEKTE